MLGAVTLDDPLEFEPEIVGSSPRDSSRESPNPRPRLGLFCTYWYGRAIDRMAQSGYPYGRLLVLQGVKDDQ
jgi:hypothetical protein